MRRLMSLRRRRLAAARFAKEDEDLAAIDREIQIVEYTRVVDRIADRSEIRQLFWRRGISYLKGVGNYRICHLDGCALIRWRAWRNIPVYETKHYGLFPGSCCPGHFSLGLHAQGPAAVGEHLYKQHDAKHGPFSRQKAGARVDKYFTKGLADYDLEGRDHIEGRGRSSRRRPALRHAGRKDQALCCRQGLGERRRPQQCR